MRRQVMPNGVSGGVRPSTRGSLVRWLRQPCKTNVYRGNDLDAHKQGPGLGRRARRKKNREQSKKLDNLTYWKEYIH